ncbi:MAG: glycosyltransferase involved in cell wall biosynthesis, partial [Burkholderiaceae bacterium]
ARYPISRIAPCRGQLPDGGNYVFFGAHWRNRLWPSLVTPPRRLIYVFNTFHPKVLTLTARGPALRRWPRTEYVLISAFQKKLLQIDGEVQPSPIDIARFRPRDASAGQPARAVLPLVVGRLSRDTEDKHAPQDLGLYRALLGAGWQVRLQGATILQKQLPSDPALQLTPEGLVDAVDFLQSLDVFYYRTGAHVETFGRVVFEAMACGLPVVCHRHGGYADHIRHGENGFLFDTTEQAAAILKQLAEAPSLRALVGANARRTVEDMFSPSALQARMQFFRR